jgi:hypothetical protein
MAERSGQIVGGAVTEVVDDENVDILGDQGVDDLRSDETGSAGDYCSHVGRLVDAMPSIKVGCRYQNVTFIA